MVVVMGVGAGVTVVMMVVVVVVVLLLPVIATVANRLIYIYWLFQ